MPPTIPLDDLLAAVGGRIQPPTGASAVEVRGASVDSRRVTPGSIYVALRGERADGHDFVADALRAGAVAALVERPVSLPRELDAPQIVVPDALHALQELAAWWRARHAVRVVGITGSTGKTVAKEMTADILARTLVTLRNRGNLNS
ncbi:MAG TPA: Mur ligase domain-containing protein, partial [Candidatus Limnocylindria bacterium]|nr:Mur ligase domain-containing protein [Candidatus Limnocylindria bacterium]